MPKKCPFIEDFPAMFDYRRLIANVGLPNLYYFSLASSHTN